MSLKYWEYFLSIELDLDDCSRYVEFSGDNYTTYSNEFARVIMAASSEFDNVIKGLCRKINDTKKPANIVDYRPIIASKYSRFFDSEVEIDRYKIKLKPWEEWTDDKRPDWWAKGYSKIKHERDFHFKEANLKNALLSVSGLLVAILYYYDASGITETIDYSRAPRLLSIVEDNHGFTGGSISWGYTLLK